MKDKYLTIKQAAMKMKKSYAWVRSLAASGRFDGVKEYGSIRLIPESSIKKFNDSRKDLMLFNNARKELTKIGFIYDRPSRNWILGGKKYGNNALKALERYRHIS